MTKAQEKKRKQYRAAIPGAGKASYQRKYDRAIAGQDPKAAIAAKCLDCMHWQRTRIRECPIVCCPLWPYRPFVGERQAAAAKPAPKSKPAAAKSTAKKKTASRKPAKKKPASPKSSGKKPSRPKTSGRKSKSATGKSTRKRKGAG